MIIPRNYRVLLYRNRRKQIWHFTALICEYMTFGSICTKKRTLGRRNVIADYKDRQGSTRESKDNIKIDCAQKIRTHVRRSSWWIDILSYSLGFNPLIIYDTECNFKQNFHSKYANCLYIIFLVSLKNIDSNFHRFTCAFCSKNKI